MAWIATIEPHEARGPVKGTYDACLRQFGFIPNIRRSLTLSPDALRGYVQLSGAVYGGGALPRKEREMIATLVSALRQCHY